MLEMVGITRSKISYIRHVRIVGNEKLMNRKNIYWNGCRKVDAIVWQCKMEEWYAIYAWLLHTNLNRGELDASNK